MLPQALQGALPTQSWKAQALVVTLNTGPCSRRALTPSARSTHAPTNSKVTHFKRIAKAAGVDFEDMLFYDNEK